uniref:histidine kinase n=1 Tax=Chrysotila carterae TaxID=13221 RepID=A0A7S4F921_CHRCT
MAHAPAVQNVVWFAFWTSCCAAVSADAVAMRQSASCHRSCGSFSCEQLLQSGVQCDQIKKLNCDCGDCCMPPPPPCQSWRELQSVAEPKLAVPASTDSMPPAAPPAMQALDDQDEGQLLQEAFLDAAGQGFELELPEDSIFNLDTELVVVGANVTLSSPGRGATLDGSGLTRIFHVHSRGRLLLQNVRLANASATNQSTTPHAPHGGAVLVEGPGSLLSMRDVEIDGATALVPEAAGGGVAAYEGAVLEMVDCKVVDCTCAADGGGIYAQACIRVVIFGCEISRCHAERGGGVLCASCEMVLVDVSVVNCTAFFGGGIMGPTSAALTLNGCTVVNCKATATYGGLGCSQGALSLTHCVILGCEATLSGGVGAFDASITIESCLIEGCTASGAPALLAFLASTFEITASRFHDCHTPRSSVIYVGPQSVLMVANSSIGHCSTGDDPIFIAGICNLTDSQISDITAAGNTGALRLTGPSSTLEMRRSSILRCVAQDGAAGLQISGGRAALYGITVEGCSVNSGGGGITVNSEGFVLISSDGEIRSLVRDCRAQILGGGVFLEAGIMEMSGTDIVECKVTGDRSSFGGGLCAFAGQALLTGVRIQRCSCGASGGGAYLLFPAKLVLRDCTFVACSAEGAGVSSDSSRGYGSGAALAIGSGGVLDMVDSYLIGCTAANRGGGVFVEGSSVVTIRTSVISNCTARFGDMIALTNEVAHSASAITFHTAGLTLDAPCGTSSLLESPRVPMAMPGLILRSSEPDGGCSSEEQPPLERLLEPGTQLATCTDGTDLVPICGPAASCFEVDIRGQATAEYTDPILVPSCECRLPAYPAPDAEDQGLAAFAWTLGCVTPRRATRVSVAEATAESLVLRLRKTMTMAESANRSLVVNVGGTDVAGGTWSVNQSALPPWISLPVTSGNFSEMDDSVIVSLAVSTSGLAEQSEPYATTIALTVLSQQSVTFSVAVLLFVSSVVFAPRSMWGGLSQGELCRPHEQQQPYLARLTSGLSGLLPFTACDKEGLPVSHSLPSSTDSRQFKLISMDAPTNIELLGVRFYSGNFFAEVLPKRPGLFEIKLELSGESVDARMMLTVDCPDDTVIGPDGTCVCDKGYEPSSELGVCQPCPSGRKKDSVSNDQCEVDSLPLVVGLTVGLVMTAIFCVIALVWRWHVSKVRMRMAKLAFEKQNRIERDFMAVTCHEVRNPLNGTAAYLQFAVGLLESASGRWGSESAGLEPIRRLSPEKTMPRRALAVETDSEAEKDCNDVAASKQGSTSRTSAGEDGDDSSEGLSGMVKGALVCTNVALRVLENLTTLERLRQGLLTMNETPSQLQDVLAEVTAVLKPQIRATGAVDLRVRADPLTDKWQFWCDKKILAQVLINIGQNAVRFTVSGFIEIAAEVSETDEKNKRGSGELHSWRPRLLLLKADGANKLSMSEGSRNKVKQTIDEAKTTSESCLDDTKFFIVTFIIRDTGPGIPADQQAKVFNRYETKGGTGLGMYLTKLQVKQMGVDVKIRSPWDRDATGAEFSFALKMRARKAYTSVVSNARSDSCCLRSSVESDGRQDSSSLLLAVATSTTRRVQEALSAVESQETLRVNPPAAPQDVSRGISAPKPGQLFADGLHVLIADDQVTNTKILRRVLRSYVNSTWNVAIVETGEEALSRVRQSNAHFDLVILDEHYGTASSMLGSQVAAEIRRDAAEAAGAAAMDDDAEAANGACAGHSPAVLSPVIISCTGNALQEGEHLLAQGVDAVWNKPFPRFLPLEKRDDFSEMQLALLKTFVKASRRDMITKFGWETVKALDMAAD